MGLEENCLSGQRSTVAHLAVIGLIFHLSYVSSSRPCISDEKRFGGAAGFCPGDPERVVGLIKGHQV